MSDDAWVRLAWSGLHPERLERLLAVHPPTDVVERIRRGSIEVDGAIADAVAIPADDRREQLAADGIELVMKERLPGQLTDLPDSPRFLFVRGRPLTERAAVAVVGTRRATSYGRRVAERIGAAVGGAGIAVVSGLALGIDGAAHGGTVDAGGDAWAVLGCGVDQWYPRRHSRLGEQILDTGGTVISEFPPGTSPAPWRFPLRNRIISGLASSVVIVEAAARGGALITARLAMEQGREVFAVPGDIDREVSEGCNRLIADGAIPLASIGDLLEGLGFLQAANPTQPSIPGLDHIDDLGTSIDELGVRLQLDPRALRIQLGRWEAMGLVRRRGDTVTRA